ncbi:type VI secretion system ATPase TssH [Bordetella hinzii]|uniref:Type VI secretion ATPase, ClpV1 family n=1 Tax=Bordetella hinzii OH87 BAL007II TaxID=1331262 RepID=A0ABR4QVV9_9BORD|nr:type VI secretion system ATPase TssH [Bordetella hinzii]KCB21817.1 type VI secretion ATPase, ClpV1 family [Bordetella hinzii OH87 BAL007II]KCB39822.1 type VI secretion ATPase, ClpV1 family [Bordetella hinzii 5132]QDJ41049.1 ClpV1 family T6SS ATPase [Bordetella hinzii]QDJ45602.1 ClpV1 family T6SS ATPase [Bordetella hinzii]QDJ54522.1 ClpV1 family T6SS ATPase [Bordetella hinzii]
MTTDIRALLGRLNPVCKTAMEEAAQLCVRQTHQSVEIEHLLLALLQVGAPDLAVLLDETNVASEALTAQIKRSVDGFKRGNPHTPALSPYFSSWFEEALLQSSLLGEQQIRSGTLLLALLEKGDLRQGILMSAPLLFNVRCPALREALTRLLPAGPEGSVPAGGLPQAAAGSAALAQYTVNLTELARQGRLDPVIGRDAEIRQLIDVLLRRRQNNPILTGEAGVGKTAIVEGLAQRIALDTIPPALKDVQICALDLALLQAGAGVRGEFENRLKGVMAEVKASPRPVILFIDEAHQLIGAGGSEGQGDAANLLKPALARGELRTIAATTWAEYKRYVERDPALVRRFQVVKVDEPSEETAVEMLRGVVPRLQQHHGVDIPDSAVRDAVRLSHRYLSGRQLPDKAVSVLDTACAYVAMAQNGPPQAVEQLDRRLAQTRERRRVLRREAANGQGDPAQEAALDQHLAALGKEQAQLAERLTAERQAVQQIRAWRARIDEAVASGQDEPGLASMTENLVRLEKGLEVLQGEEPLVPSCVDSATVARVISSWTGIPVGRMLTDELHTVLNLEDRLRERVVGQDAALDAIARRVRTFRADLDDPRKPVGVFLLAGPSGVGKTETAAALADILYGGERNMITVNLSEFQEAHSVSGLKGAPPGYVGYGKGGVLTEAVRRRPYSVVLLDEIEKAHPDVLELFFQVFDKGEMEDGEGVAIDFRNTLIILTTNAAQDVITDACLSGGRPDPESLRERLRPVLARQFSPAFLGRTVVVPYYPLGDSQIETIVKLKLNKIAERIRLNHAVAFQWTPDVVAQIARRCREVDSGARNVDHILTHAVLPEIAERVLDYLSTGRVFSAIRMSVDDRQGFLFDLPGEQRP